MDCFALHASDELARQTQFGQRAVHGLLGLAATADLKNRSPLQVEAVASLHWSCNLIGPISVGDIVTIRLRIAKPDFRSPRLSRTPSKSSSLIKRAPLFSKEKISLWSNTDLRKMPSRLLQEPPSMTQNTLFWHENTSRLWCSVQKQGLLYETCCHLKQNIQTKITFGPVTQVREVVANSFQCRNYCNELLSREHLPRRCDRHLLPPRDPNR